jgi:hypothetical protein
MATVVRCSLGCKDEIQILLALPEESWKDESKECYQFWEVVL